MTKRLKIALLFCLLMGLMASIHAMGEEETVPEGYGIVYFQDGSKVMIPAEIANDPQKLSEYCAAYFPGRAYSFDISAGDFDAVLSAQWMQAQYGEGSMAVGVKLVQIGLYESVVTLQGEELTAPSMHLTFGGNDDSEHRIGVVYAPRTGEASLREEAGGNAKVLEQAKTGRVVAILEYDGSTFTKILYDGVEGYIRTDCLLFHSGEKAPLGTGILHIKGATDGTKTVAVRCTASTSQAKVTNLPTGTVVSIFEQSGSWYGVESDGWYGYVQEQYLDME